MCSRQYPPFKNITYILFTLPNISALAILSSSRNPPKSPKWGPQNEFPGIIRTKSLCGNSAETRISRNFLAHPDFGFRVPIFRFWGEMKLLCWAALIHSNFSELIGIRIKLQLHRCCNRLSYMSHVSGSSQELQLHYIIVFECNSIRIQLQHRYNTEWNPN